MQSCLQDSLDIFCPASDSGLSARQQKGWLAMCNLPGVEFNVGYCLLSTTRVFSWPCHNCLSLATGSGTCLLWMLVDSHPNNILYLLIYQSIWIHLKFVLASYWSITLTLLVQCFDAMHFFVSNFAGWFLRLNGMGASVLVIDEVGVLSPRVKTGLLSGKLYNMITCWVAPKNQGLEDYFCYWFFSGSMLLFRGVKSIPKLQATWGIYW